MALTLNELAKVSTDPLEKAVLVDMLRQSDLLKILPVKSVGGLKVKATRWQTLPTVATRKIGAGYTASEGKTEQVEESLFVYGGDIEIDRVLTKVTDVIEDPFTTQTQMKVQALMTKFTIDFINGDHATDPDGFEGLKKRISNLPARMTIDLSPGSGDSLKVLASAATENTFLDGLHDADKRVGGANAWLMNENSYQGFGKVLRRLGLMDTTQDNYDRVWEMFKRGKLVDVGLQTDETTEIITDTEDPGDAGNDATSLYAVRFGTTEAQADPANIQEQLSSGDDGLYVIQLNGTMPTPYDPLGGSEIEARPSFLRRIDWVIGTQMKGKYATCRVKGFKMAAA
jgi:hypothetical protein